MTDSRAKDASAILRIWRAIKPTDGPGHSDQPRVDIKAHRTNAKMTRWMGYALMALALFGLRDEPVTLAVAFVGVFVFTQVLSLNFRMEALEWEVQLDDE